MRVAFADGTGREVDAGARDPEHVTDPDVTPLRLADATVVVNNAGVGAVGWVSAPATV